ncbi:MAG: hypothetical protein V1672_05420 [Candidatus Diapherotrites archaeon]
MPPRRPTPKRFQKPEIRCDAIRKIRKVQAPDIKENDAILIERHNAPSLIGFHDGHELKLTHQLNREGTHFKTLVTDVARMDSEARMQKSVFTMSFNPDGTLKYPKAVKSIHLIE